MVHLLGHLAAAGALAFVDLRMAVGALLPDVAWLRNEAKIRRSQQKPQQVIDSLTDASIRPYRMTHSLWLWSAVAVADWRIAIGAVVHLLLDWPTHDGRMRQQPLWPLPIRWPSRWVLRAWRHA